MKNVQKLFALLLLVSGQYAFGSGVTVASSNTALAAMNSALGEPIICQVARDISVMSSTDKTTNYPLLLQLFNAPENSLELGTLCLQNYTGLTTVGAILADFVAKNISNSNGMLRWTTNTRLATLLTQYPTAVAAATITGSTTNVQKIANVATWSVATPQAALLAMLQEIQAIEDAVSDYNANGATNDALVTDL